jgi:hypothetical protein
MSIREIARRLDVSQSTASELKHVTEARSRQVIERVA